MPEKTKKPFLDRLNDSVANSQVGSYFQLKERQSTFTTEFRAGTVTFLTMAYILAVNAGILKDTGGPCSVNDCEINKGQPNCMFGTPGKGFDTGYLRCAEEAKRSFISATAASSLVACFLMGIMANMPLALAPGMGINAFFAYTVVGFFGRDGMLSYKQAVAAAFIEGWLFLFISVIGVRGHIIRLVPRAIMLATAGGIGMYLAFIGLQANVGIGLINYDSATLVTVGGCPIAERASLYTIHPNDINNVCSCQLVNGTAVPTLSSPNLGPKSAVYTCLGKRLQSATTWLGAFGGVMMVMLMGRDFRGAIMIGILFVTFVSWIPNHKATYLGASSQIPGGEARYDYFKKVVTKPDVTKTALAWDWSAAADANFWAATISFLYLDFLDCTGTLFSMATFLNRTMPGFLDPNTREFPKQTASFCVDAISIILGALLGISPLTVYIESATGIREGGRTGMTTLTVSFWFFIALFFTPIIASIPPYATGPALVLVGALMMENFLDICWGDIQEAVPAFLTIVLIPLTYSIPYGVIAGLGSYLCLYLFFLAYDLVCSALGWSEDTIAQVLHDAMPECMASPLLSAAPSLAADMSARPVAEAAGDCERQQTNQQGAGNSQYQGQLPSDHPLQHPSQLQQPQRPPTVEPGAEDTLAAGRGSSQHHSPAIAGQVHTEGPGSRMGLRRRQWQILGRASRKLGSGRDAASSAAEGDAGSLLSS